MFTLGVSLKEDVFGTFFYSKEVKIGTTEAYSVLVSVSTVLIPYSLWGCYPHLFHEQPRLKRLLIFTKVFTTEEIVKLAAGFPESKVLVSY